MKHKDLVHSLAVKMNSSENEIETLLQSVLGIMKTEITTGNTISFQGFGAFEIKRKEERLSVHPVTKARTLIPPKLVVNFKQSSTLKVKLKEIPHHE
jgi:DNA-binding protein HU-beta